MAGKMKDTGGFTLIEILIAMTILMVGLLAIAAMQITALRVNSTALSITERATLAQDKMEELVLLSYDNGSLADTAGGSPHEDTDVPAGFTLTWTVDEDAANSYKEITVSATKGGKTLSIYFIKPEF